MHIYRYSEAEFLYIKAYKILKGFLAEGENEAAIEMLTLMSNLGLLYKSQGRYSEAESIYLEILESHKYFQGENLLIKQLKLPKMKSLRI